VTENYREDKGTGYIGSRDIDLGFPVDPSATAEELQAGNIGTTFDALRYKGFYRSRSGFQKHFDSMTVEELTEDEASQLPMHQVVDMRVDIQPTITESETFNEAFGFQPPAEPLLKQAFDGASRPLTAFVDWDLPEAIRIVDHTLLAAMKIGSFPGRNKHHKKVKDLADLYALIWYAGEWQHTVEEARSFVEREDIDRFQASLEESLIDEAAVLLESSPDELRQVFDEIVR
jgi:hypothetical protein